MARKQYKQCPVVADGVVFVLILFDADAGTACWFERFEPTEDTDADDDVDLLAICFRHMWKDVKRYPTFTLITCEGF